MDKVRDGFLTFLCILGLLFYVALIPGYIYVVIRFAPVWIPFIEAHLILKVLVISLGVAGGTMLLIQLVNASVSAWRGRE